MKQFYIILIVFFLSTQIQAQNSPFITTWEVNSSYATIELRADRQFTYSYNVDFGDGTTYNNVTGNVSHNYSTSGIYIISITGDFPRFDVVSCGNNSSCKLLSIDQWGDIEWQSMEYAFGGHAFLSINATDTPDLSQVTSMKGMFMASSINQDINNWDVSNVENMELLFYNATSFNQPLNSWNVSNVKSMFGMFRQATNFNQPLDNWDVSNVEIMGGNSMYGGMFEGASSFNQPLNNWDVRKVVDFNNMFQNAVSFNQPLSNWDLDAAMHIHGMFNGAASFNQDLSFWDFDNLLLRPTINLNTFIRNSGLDVINYELLLNKFVGTGISEKSLQADGLSYCNENLRDILVNDLWWTVEGDNLTTTCNTYPSTAFVTSWKVDSGDLSITIPVIGSGYNYNVDFGDGTIHSNVTTSAFHTYSAAGSYRVSITGDFPRIYFNNSGDKNKLYSIIQWGAIEWQSMENAFYGCSNLNILAPDAPDLSLVSNLANMFKMTSSMNSSLNHWDVTNVTDMSGMFENSIAFNKAINSWSVGNVTNMSGMFKNASSFNQSIDSWNVSNVTDMSEMFKNATVFNQSLNSWNVAGVTDMGRMFQNAVMFNRDISIWDFNNNVILAQFLDGSNMIPTYYDNLLDQFVSQNLQNKTLGSTGLSYCNEIARNDLVNNLNWTITGDTLYAFCAAPPFITLWQVEANDLGITIPTTGSGYNYNIDFGDGYVLTNVSGNATHLYSQPGTYRVSISGNFPRINFGASDPFNRMKLKSVEQWGAIQWMNMAKAFQGCIDLKINANDAPNLNAVMDMSEMFRQAINFNSNINHWDVSQVVNMEGMFNHARSFDQPLGNWDVSSATTLTNMFRNARSFNQVIDTWQVGNVLNMEGMFYGASSYNQPLNNWDISSVISLEEVFTSAISFNQDLSNWDTSNVNKMSYMFFLATSFNQSLNNWDVSNVFTMESMFHKATAFDQPLDDWDVSFVVNMQEMFREATSFNQSIDNWDLSEVTSVQSMFQGATSFNQPLNNWNVSQIYNMSSLFKNAISFNQPLDNWYLYNVSGVSEMFYGADSFNQDISNWNFNSGINLQEFLNNSNFDVINYDKLLNSFVQMGYQNKLLGASGLFFCDDTFHNKLVNDLGWTITGDNQAATCSSKIADAFVTLWNIEPGDLTITIPTTGSGYDYTIDFGDGTVLSNQTGNATHTYAQPGMYNVSITGDFPRVYFNNGGDRNKIIYVLQWGEIEWSSMAHAFYGCSNLKIIATDIPDFGAVTDMSNMLKGAIEFNAPVNGWDVANVADMSGMFSGATSFNQDLSDWTFNNGVNLSEFLDDSGLRVENYDLLLAHFSTLNLQNKTLGALNLHYCDQTSRDNLINNLNWVVSGDALYKFCTFANAFITHWTTTQGLSITIPTIGSGYNYSVDFGDGTILTNVTGNVTHTYSQSLGAKTVKIIGDFPRFYLYGLSPTERQKLMSVSQWGDIEWHSMKHAFAGRTVSINATDAPDLSRVTDMSYMFAESIGFNSNINNWDVSNVQNMSYLFHRAKVFNQPLNNWNVENVTDMGFMFEQAIAFNQPINSWDVSNVTNMRFMFAGNNQDISAFNQPLNNWDTSNVTDMEGMFRDAGSFNQPLNNWDVSSVTNMSQMFYTYWGALWPTVSPFNQPVGSWNVENVVDMSYMFYGAGNFDQPLNNWDVSNVENMNSMFAFAQAFNQPIGNWDVSSVTDMGFMFMSSNVHPSLFNQPLDSWDVSLVTDMGHMFWNSSYNQSLNNWDVSNVVEMSRMFTGSSFNQPLNNWDVSNVKYMTDMFSGTPFNQPLDNWNVSNVLYMIGIFGNASDFNQDLSNWNFNQNVFLSFPGFRGMVAKSGLDVANYDALLGRFVQLGLQNKRLASDDLYYCDETSHNLLMNNLGWNITGDALTVSCDMYKNPFVTTWEVTANDLGITVEALGDFGIDFGDGTVVSPVFGTITHTYSQPGIYTVTMGGEIDRISFHNAGSRNKILSIEAWGGNQWKSFQGAFQGCSNLVVNAIDAPDLSQVVNMEYMFQDAVAFNQPIDHWDVSNVQHMAAMFNGATTFNQPLGSWDVSNVQNMSSMFWGATAFDQSLNTWDVSNVTNMHRMFENATSFNQPVDTWNVVNVTDMGYMFKNANSFNQDISDWNFNASVHLYGFLSYSNLDTPHYDMLLHSLAQSNIHNKQLDAEGLKYCDQISRDFLINNLGWSFNGDSLFSACDLFYGNPFITTWEVTNNDLNIAIPTNGSGFDYGIDFGDGTVLADVNGNISHTFNSPGIYTVKIVGDFPRIFFSLSSDKHKILSIDQWGDIEWHSMRRAFHGCSNLILNTTDAPNLEQVTDLSEMFSGASSLNQSINHWGVSGVTKMEGMFENASLFNQPLDDWNVSEVINMNNMFQGAEAFNQELFDWNFHPDVSLEGFLSYSGLDTSNYNSLLTHFVDSALMGKILGADGLVYCEDEDRNQLLGTMGWTIIGDEQDEFCKLSLTENKMGNVLIYPVPTNDVLYIDTTREIVVKNIKMFDIQGRLIKTIEGAPQEISVERLPSGVYFLLFSGENEYQVKQFVKK